MPPIQIHSLETKRMEAEMTAWVEVERKQIARLQEERESERKQIVELEVRMARLQEEQRWATLTHTHKASIHKASIHKAYTKHT